MSPIAQQKDGRTVATARVFGAGSAGALELMMFHPVDTVAKRLMTNKETFSKANWLQVIFQDSAEKGTAGRLKALFPGLGFGAVYKISQRIYKFGGQPYVKEFVKTQTKAESKAARTFSDGLAGAFMGMGEVVLLPLDALKIKAQTNPEFRNKGFVTLFKQEGLRKLYAGWQWTMARNAPGSFCLFGANGFVKEYVFHLKDHRDATFLQTTVSSVAGSVSSIVVACPLDVVKTRIQSGTFGNEGGIRIIQNIVQQEGMGSFFKGSIPKVVTVGPKLIFSFTIAQYLMAKFER